jgi:predicted dehydrogenase
MPESRDIGFGIVGTGSIADFHARAIAQVPGARVVAVTNRSGEKGAAFAATHGVSFEKDLASLLARRDLDVLCVTTPSGAHGVAVEAALQAGKHVLVEKPIEITTPRIDALIELGRKRDRFIGVVFPVRMGDGAQALKRAVEQGRFGRLTLCSAYVKWWRTDAYYRSGQWRGTWELDGGGALMNQGIHAVDLLLWLTGMPTSVTAHAATLAHAIDVEDTIVAGLTFAHGALGSIECSTSCAPGSARRIEISGTRGSATLEDDRITRWDFDAPRPEDDSIKHAARDSGIGGGSSDPKAIGIEGHRRVIEAMTHAVRSGTPPAIDGVEGRRSVSVIEAIYRAGRTHRAESPA